MQRRRHRPSRARCAAAAALLGVAACDPALPSASPIDLRRGLAAAGQLFVIVPDASVLEKVQARIERNPPAGWDVVVGVESPAAPSGGTDPHLWIGTPASPGCARGLERLGVERLAAGFRFQGQECAGPGDGLLATVGDPQRAGAVVAIVLCNDLEQGLAWIDDITPTSRTGWQVLRGGAVAREGRVTADGAAESDGAIDVEHLRAKLAEGARTGERPYYDWVAPPAFDPEQGEVWLAELDRAANDVRRRFGDLAPLDTQGRLTLRIHETPEELALVYRRREFAVLQGEVAIPELALVHVPGWPDNAPFDVARASAELAYGEPRARWLLDAVAAASTDAWFDRPSASWLAHLVTGELVPTVAELAGEGGGTSPHVAAPLRGALLEHLEELRGVDFAARAWAQVPAEIELPADKIFRAWLAAQLGPELEAARAARAERRAAALARPARRGACLVPSPPRGDPLGGGFGTRACEQSLGELARLGADSVAFTWCVALEASEPRLFGAGARPWTQAEDPALFAAILGAQSLGLGVVLMPQFVATEHGGFAGRVMLTTPRTRRALFDGWQRDLVHLGLLAELAGVDVLSLGSEAPDAAVTRPSEQNRRPPEELESLRADWRALIAKCRGAFAGGLTYAAGWDGEAQGIEFWSELDFLGQNLFGPYDVEPPPGPPVAADYTRRITGAFRHLARLAEERGVRPFVCGIGLSSSADGWRQPSRPQGALDLEPQARFYDGLVRALRIGERQRFAPAGLYAWCWSSDPEAGGPLDRGFTPQHKPAEGAFARALRVR